MKWSSLKLLTPPSDPVVTLDEAKAQLRVFHADDDDLIERLIRAATAAIEGPKGIGVALLNQTWVGTLPSFGGSISLHLTPVRSIVSITYRDTTGSVQTLDPSLYAVDVDQEPAVIVPVSSWPSTAVHPGAVKVTFVAGYGRDRETVPEDLRHAVLMTVAHWYENREAVSGQTLTEVPMAVRSILSRFEVYSLG